MPRDINRWTLVTGGTEGSHQHSMLTGHSMKAGHLAILTFTKFKIVQRVHVEMDNKVALSDLVKMWGRGTHNKGLLGLSKQIWDYLQSKKITITSEYLPDDLNGTADWESCIFQDKRDWKLSL